MLELLLTTLAFACKAWASSSRSRAWQNSWTGGGGENRGEQEGQKAGVACYIDRIQIWWGSDEKW